MLGLLRAPLTAAALSLLGLACTSPSTEASPVPTATPECSPSAPVVFERSPSGAHEVDAGWLSTHRCAVRVVDVRSVAERTSELGQLEGSESAPLDELDAHAKRWSTEEAIVLVDRSGRRAARAQEHLETLGFKRVASLTGGMLAWQAAGLPVASAGPATAREPEAKVRSHRGEHAPIGRDAIAHHLADEHALHWVSVAELMAGGTQACIDGRDESPVVGTPGGDAGELVLALAALEKTAGRPLDLERIPKLFDAYVAAFGRFYLHSDEHAIERLGEHLRQDLRFAAVQDRLGAPKAIEGLVRHPPAELEGALLEHLTRPDAVGCGHLRLMLQNPDEYGARRELTEAVVRAAFRRGWEHPELLRFVVLEGEHEEGAVVRVHLDHEVHTYTRVPTFAPHASGIELFVVHPEVSAFVRRENGAFLLEHRDELVGAAVDERAYLGNLDDLARRQFAATAGRLASKLPVYDVRFHGERHEVEGPAAR